MNEQEKNIVSNQKDDKVQVYENDDAYLFGEELSGDGSLEVGYKNSSNENKNKLINQKELLNKFNTNLSQDDEQEQEQEQNEEILNNNHFENNNENNLNDDENNLNNNENILNNNTNNKNNSFKEQKYIINDINSDMENEEGGEDGNGFENQENGNYINENENDKINDNYIINNNINQNNQNSNNIIESKKIINQNENQNNNINDNQNEELEENESDSGVPLVTLNFLSICQCCKNSFNSKDNIPYLFKCGHFFCKQCIIEQFTDEEGIKCPNDGLIANSISDLKILNNFITDKTVTQRTSSPFSSPEGPGGEKNKFNSKISKNVNTNDVKNDENIQNYQYKYCEFHKGQKLTHFIEETKELICVYCAFERFKQNQGMEIKEISDKCHDMEAEMDTVIEENQYNVGIIQTSLKEIKKNKENEEKKINEIFDRFIELIKSKKEEYLGKVDNLFTNNAEKLSQKLELFSNKIEKSESAKEKINLFLNNQDSSQFLQLYEYYNKIRMELQSVHSLKLNLQKYNFNYEDEMEISRMISKFGEIKLTPKIFTFIGETTKDEKDFINDCSNFNKIKKFDGIKVKLNNNINYNNLNSNNDNINNENPFQKYNNNINDNMNCQNTFQKYSINNNDNMDMDNLNSKNNSSMNFYKKSLNNKNNTNTKTYQITGYQKNNINNINQNKYIDYSNQMMEHRNKEYNKKNKSIGKNNNLINYDKYSIPKNINNDILKGRNSPLNEGIRLNTPNSLSKIYQNCMNNNNNLIIKNNFYNNNTNNNSLGKKINNSKINMTQVKNNRNSKGKNNKKNSLQFKYNLKSDIYKNKSYSFLTNKYI